MRQRPVRLALAILAAGWLWTGLLATPHDAVAAEKVVVAITSPQSGPQAAWGIELIRGAELALAEYDPSKLKFSYEILPMDDTADPKVGITIANKLKVDKDVMAVIGPWNSGVAIPASPIYSEAQAAALRHRQRPEADAPGVHQHLPDGLDERLPGDRRRGVPGRRAQEEARSRSSTTTRSPA